jgi:hypothetical protein
MTLEVHSVIAPMHVGQRGSLLPNVVVSSILTAFLITEWHLSGTQGTENDLDVIEHDHAGLPPTIHLRDAPQSKRGAHHTSSTIIIALAQ